MISGPTMDGFYFWRRRSLLKREIIAQIFPIIVGLTQLANASIDLKFVELTAYVVRPTIMEKI